MCYEMTSLHKRAQADHCAERVPVLRSRRAEPGRIGGCCNLQRPRGSGLDAHVLTRAFLQKRSEPNPKLTKRTKVNQSQARSEPAPVWRRVDGLALGA